MKYRPHRGSLSDSMREVCEFEGRAALVDLLAKDLAQWGIEIEDADVRVEPFGFDARIGWETHLVTIRNKRSEDGIWYFGVPPTCSPDYFGAIGYTDGAVA